MATNKKNIIVIEPNANATIIEHYSNSDKYLHIEYQSQPSSQSQLERQRVYNTEIVLEAGASIVYYLMQTTTNNKLNSNNNINDHSNSINTTITQHDNSKLTFISLEKDNNLNHTDVIINLSGNNTTTNSYIYNCAENKTINSLNLTVNNQGKNCKSKTIYRAVINDKAKTSFTGNIVVNKDATRTDATLQCKSLLLSKFAEANSKPFLEINCDDVKCAHGATVGYLDLDAIFYLRSRGISLDDAKQMLIESFISPITSQIHLEPIKKLFAEHFGGLNYAISN